MTKTIVIYGASNVHGTGPAPDEHSTWRHPRADRWTTVMADQLGAGYEVLAEGLPGRTSVLDDPARGEHYNGLRVLPAILASHAPIDLLVLLLGTNDLQAKFGYRTYDIKQAVEHCVLAARQSGHVQDILVMSPVPVREVGTYAESYAGAEARQVGMADALKSMADHNNTGFFDAASVAVVSDIDGVHFDAENHHKLGQAMADAVATRMNG